MTFKVWAIASLILLVALLAVIEVFVRKKKRAAPDYYSFYVMGVTWLVVGIPLGNIYLMALGFFFGVIGILNKGKWKENKQSWSELKEDEKRYKLTTILLLVILVLAGVAFLYFVKKGIV